MRLSDLLRAGISAMTAHKFRSVLTLLGVTLGALLLFCSISGGLGVIDAVNRRLAVGDRLLEIIVNTGVQTDEVTPEKARAAGFTEDMSDERRVRLAQASGVGGVRPVPMNLGVSESLKRIAGVESVWSRLRFRCSIYLQTVDRFSPGVVYAMPPKKLDYSKLIVATGTKTVAAESSASNPPERGGVWVSELFLYQQGIRTEAEIEDVIGTMIQVTTRHATLEGTSLSGDNPRRQKAIESLKFRSRIFPIRGVFRYPERIEIRDEPEWAQMLGVAVMMPYDDAADCWRGLDLADKSTTAVVRATSPELLENIEAEISDTGFRTHSLAELATQIRTAVLLVTLLITSIATAALLISAIGITNTMVMNVLERRKDIAVMKAIGARDRDLKRMFLIEGFLMGLIGGLSGLVLGLIFSRICGDWIRQELETRLNEPLYGDIFAYPVWLIMGTPIVASLITMLASYVPAKRAAKIDPAQTLRGL
ncbi:ABC transporter permease [Planctomycetes bacterium K23_9]|uniref:Macrolide export ATP-binding/permease protein MacB n=1 Tax=Stieleria marina TaxID=1930275 RepID=A0A517NTP6_9BACT|nr:Macrolide export ATP-binding/permease protein MacB [Planctomycetes bacterium K23_9]